MNAWKPVAELPDSEITVIIHMPDASEPIWLGYHDGEQWFTVEGTAVKDLEGEGQVAHWMHLPEPPPSSAGRRYIPFGMIFVRDYSGTHIARLNGKQATCTSGREQAAHAVAIKVIGTRPYKLQQYGGNDMAWELLVDENATQQGRRSRTLPAVVGSLDSGGGK